MIKLGIIGTGSMAGGHARNFSAIKGVKVTACCDISEDRAKAFAKKWKIPRVYSDYRKMLNNEPLDAITNVTPDTLHAPITIYALKKRVHVLCEKPLATSLADARKMAAAAKKHRLINMVNFSYRGVPAIHHAAEQIRKGKIGRIIHVEASYLQSWVATGRWITSSALIWRLSKKHGSAGTLGDTGCHIYDATALLCGNITEINCKIKTFDKGRRNNRLGEYVLDANDSFFSNVVFENGALGTIHGTRWAPGHDNAIRIRVYGDKGAVEVDYEWQDPSTYNRYRIVTGTRNIDRRNWRTVRCGPVPNIYQRFITAIKGRRKDPSDFNNGVRVQAYLHYSFLSDSKKKPFKVKI